MTRELFWAVVIFLLCIVVVLLTGGCSASCHLDSRPRPAHFQGGRYA